MTAQCLPLRESRMARAATSHLVIALRIPTSPQRPGAALAGRGAKTGMGGSAPNCADQLCAHRRRVRRTSATWLFPATAGTAGSSPSTGKRLATPAGKPPGAPASTKWFYPHVLPHCFATDRRLTAKNTKGRREDGERHAPARESPERFRRTARNNISVAELRIRRFHAKNRPA